jgi:hypothetical protein
MPKYITCVPSLNDIQKAQIDEYIKEIKQLKTTPTKDDIVSNVLSFVIASNPDIIVKYEIDDTGKYENLPEELQGIVTEITDILQNKKFGINRKKVNYQIQKLAQPVQDISVSEEPVLTETEQVNEENYTSNNEFDDNEGDTTISPLEEEINEITVKRIAKLPEGEATFATICARYFPTEGDLNYFQTEFKSFFTSSYFQNIYGFDGENYYFNNPEESKEQFKQYLTDLAKSNRNVQNAGNNLTNFKDYYQVEDRNAFYAFLSKIHFESLAAELIPGLEKVKKQSSSFNSKDIAISTYVSFNKFAESFLENTPLLKVEVKNNQVNFTSVFKEDGLSVMNLKRNDLALVFNSIIGLDHTSDEEFYKEFKELIDRSTGKNKDILYSLYNKYFSPTEYIVDGEPQFSLRMLAEDLNEFNSRDLLSSIKSSLISSREKSYTTTTNNVTDFSNVFLSQAASQSIDDFKRNLVTTDNGKERLKKDLLNNIDFKINDEGSPILVIKLGRTEYKILLSEKRLTNLNKLYLKAEEKVNITPAVQKKLLKHLLGSGTFLAQRREFFNAFSKLTNDTNSMYASYNMNDLIVNIAWVLKSYNKNNETEIQEFSDQLKETGAVRNVVYKKDLENLSDKLYDALDTGFNSEDKNSKLLTSLLTKSADLSISLDVPQTVLNLGGDKVATTTNITSQALVNNYINRVDKANRKNPEKVLLRRNIFVGKNAKFKVGKTYTMNGIQLYDKVKSFKDMSPKEGNIYLIENIYLEALMQTQGNSTAFLTTIHADKSSHDAQMFSRTDKGFDFMPLVSGTKKLNVEFLSEKLIETRRNFHQDLGNQIIEKWKPVLLASNVDITGITDIASLNKLLNNIKFNLDYIKGTSLNSEVEYCEVETIVDGKKIRHAGINPYFVYQHEIWNDSEKSKKYINEKFRQFKNDLKECGYLKVLNGKFKRHSDSIPLSALAQSYLKNKFGSVDITDVYTSYFYNKLILGDEFNNAAGSLFYQSTNGLLKPSTQETINKEIEALIERKEKEAKDKGKILELSDEDLYAMKMRTTMSLADQVMFADFIKRAGPQATSGHRIELKGKTEKGLYFEEYSFNAVVADPETKVKLLGTLTETKAASYEIYNAFTIGYPFYRDKVNNGIGSNDIHATFKGAFKTLNNSKDVYNGYGVVQKNIVMPLNYQLIVDSVEYQNMFIKMGSAIKFNEQGLSTLSINGVTCNTVHEMFLALGGFTSFDEAIEELGVILSENPEYRSMYIETITFPSGQKRGVSDLNQPDVLYNSEIPLKYQQIPTTNLITVLNLEHNPDSTASLNSDEDNSRVSSLTQAFSAAPNEGATKELSISLMNSLNNLAGSELNMVEKSIKDTAVELLYKKYLSVDKVVDTKEREEVFQLVALYNTNFDFKNERLDFYLNKYKLITVSQKKLIANLTKDALKTSSVKGPAGDLLNESEITLESLQLSNVSYIALNSYIEKLAVRMKFSGGQQVVAPAHDLFKLYTTKNGNKLNRSSYNKVADKDTLITLDNYKQYLDTDLVLFNGSTIMFGSVKNKVGSDDVILGADFSKESTNLEMMTYYRLKEDGVTKEFVYDLDIYKTLIKEKNTETRRELEKLLQSTLNNGNWFTIPTEFFGPSFHLAAYNLEEDALLVDIIGDLDINNESNIPSIIENSSEYFKKKLTDLSADSVKLNNLIENKNPTASILYLLNQSLNNSDNKQSLKSIRTRLVSIESIDSFIKNITKDLKKVEVPEVDEFIKKLKTALETEYKSLKNQGLHEDKNYNYRYDEILNEVSYLGKDLSAVFIDKLSKEQGKDFYKTLTFFTGRIPGQAKQSATVGQLKSFINSTANTLYSPASFSHLTGQDHDGDKLNSIVYSVDNFGRIYDYSRYLDNEGNISDNVINNRKQNIINNILAKKDEIKASIKGQLNMAGKSDEEIELTTNKEIKEKITSALKAEHSYFINSIKNKVLDDLIKIWSSPKNAVESQRAITMDELNKSLSKTITIIDEKESEENALLTRRVSKDNPGSDLVMKEELLGGKDVVGIEANFLKVNGAWTMAYVNDANHPGLQFAINNFLKEGYVLEHSDKSDEVVIYNYDENNNLIRKSSKRLADTGNLNYQDINSKQIQNLIKDYKESNLYKELINSEAYRILIPTMSEDTIINYILTNSFVDKNLSQIRANEYISQLLSAATDNAKEFILGQIGADVNTSGIISSGILLGFTLSDMMSIVKDENVVKLLKQIKESQTVYERGYPESLKNALKKYIVKTKSLKERIKQSDKPLNSLKNDKKKLESAKSSSQYKSEGVLENPMNVYGDDTKIYDINKANPKINDEILNKFKAYYKETINNELQNVLEIFSMPNVDTIILSSSKLPTNALNKLAKDLNKNIIFLFDTSLSPEDNVEQTPFIRGKYIIATQKATNILPEIKDNNKKIYETNELNENVYDLKQLENLNTINEKIKSYENIEEDTKKEILTDKVRQFAMFFDIKTQLTSLSTVLGINQGMHSSVISTKVFLDKVSDALGVTVNGLNNHLERLESKEIEYSALPELEVSGASKVFDINYILQCNPHFIKQLKAELLKYTIINESNKVSDAFHNITLGISNELQEELELLVSLREKGEADEETLLRINELTQLKQASKFIVNDEEKGKNAIDFIYKYAVDDYYNNNKNPNQTKIKFDLNIQNQDTILNTNYDLFFPADRTRFINDLPIIIEKLKSEVENLEDNLFFKEIITDSVYEKVSKTKSILLKPLSRLNLKSDSDQSILADSFKALEKHKNLDVQKLYEALNHYALIVYQGGRSANSFGSLTDNIKNDLWVSFNKSLRDLDIEKLINNLNIVSEYKDLLIPSTIAVKSTEEYDSKILDDEFDSDDYVPGRTIKRYDRMPKIEGAKTPPPYIFKSKELNEIYVLTKGFDDKLHYMPITMKYNSYAIPFNLNSNGDVFEKLGYSLGKPAKISTTENGHVLYYDQIKNVYVVKNQYGKMDEINVEEIQSLNQDMKFDRTLFGPKNITEYGEKAHKLELILTPTSVKQLTENLNYTIINDVDSGKNKGDVLYTGKAEHQGQNIFYSIIYEGEYTTNQISEERIKSNFGVKDQMKIQNIDEKNKANKYKVARIVLHNTPNVTIKSFSKVEGFKYNDKVINMESPYLISNRKLENTIDIIKLSSKNNRNNFYTFEKETSGAEPILFSDFINDCIKNNKSPLKELNLSEAEYKSIQKELTGQNRSTYYIYKVKPVDLRARIFNSLQEMNLYRSQEIKPNLDQVTIYQENDFYTNILQPYGVSLESIRDVKEYSLSSFEKIKQELPGKSELLDNFFKVLSKNEVNTVVIFASLNDQHFFDLVGKAREVYLNDGKILPGMTALSFETAKKQIAIYEEKVKANPQRYNFNTYKDHKTAAKIANKNIFVYDTNKNQWFVEIDGDLVQSKIPTITSGGLVTLGTSSIRKKPEYLETILKASSNQNNLSEGSEDKEYSIKEFDFVSIESDLELNTPIISWDTKSDNVLQNIQELSNEDISVYHNYTQQRTEDETTGKITYSLDGKDLKDFIEQDNVTVKVMPDGCVVFTTISDKNIEKNYVYIPENKSLEYADFKGDKVFNNFKFFVKGKNLYFDINKIHYVENIKSFEIRNKLIEEKTELKELYKVASDYKINRIDSFYKNLRYPKNAAYSRTKMFEGIGSLKAFVNSLSLDFYLDQLTPQEKLVAQELAKNYQDYLKLLDNAREKKKLINKKYTSRLKVNSKVLAFNPENNSHVLIVPTISGKTDSLIDPEFLERYIVTKTKGEDGRTFVLPSFKYDEGRLISNRKYLVENLQELVETAIKNPTKTYFFKLPNDSLLTNIIPETTLTGKNLAMTLAQSFTLAKNAISEWPSNIVMPESLLEFTRTNDGFTDLSKINKTKPFITVGFEEDNAFGYNNDKFLNLPMDPENSELSVRDVWAKWKGVESNSETMYSLFSGDSFARQAFGNETKAFTQLVRYWAANNPKSLNRIAAEIGNRNIKNFNINNDFSFATALTQVLNEKYIYNTDISLSVQEKTDLEIYENQSMVALKRNNIKFNENGEALMKDSKGEIYKLKVINDKHPAIAIGNLDIELGRALVSEPVDIVYNRNNESFVLATVIKFNEPIKEKYVYSEGQLSKQLEDADIKLTEEQSENSKIATHILPIDINSNITETVEERLSGNPRITSIVSAIKENINVDYDNNSQIMLIGTTLSDAVYNIQDIQNVITLYSGIIKRGIDSKATFLIDKETGITDQLKAYILNNENYVQEGNKLVFDGSPKDIITSKKLYIKAENNSRVLNKNNDFNRGQTISGMVQMFDLPQQNFKSYSVLNVSDSEILDWHSKINAAEVFENIETSEENISLEKTISLAVSKQKNVISNIIQTHILHKNNIKLGSNKNMASIIIENEVLNKEYNEMLDKVFEFFNDTRLKISIRSNNIRNNYIQENFPELANDTNKIFYEYLTSLNVLDNNEIQKEVLKTPISKEFLNEVSLNASSVEDIFHLLTSTNGYLFNKGKLEGQKAAVILNQYLKGIKAFKTNTGLLILDHSNVAALNPGKEYDGTVSTIKTQAIVYNNIEKYIQQNASELYRYLKNYQLIKSSQVDNNSVYFNLPDTNLEEFSITESSSNEAFNNEAKNKLSEVKQFMYDKLTSLYDNYIISNLELSVSNGTDSEKISNALIAKHIRSNKPVEGNPWSYYFRKENPIPVGDELMVRDLKINEVYRFTDNLETTFQFMKVKLSKDAGVVIIYKEEGSDKIKIAKIDEPAIYTTDILNGSKLVGEIRNEIDLSTNVINKPITSSLNNLGKTFSKIIVNNEILIGNFKLTRDGMVVNIDEETDKILDYFQEDISPGVNMAKWKKITETQFKNFRNKQPDIFKKGDDLDKFCSIS